MPKGHYQISVSDHFSAAHIIRGYPGDCEHLHGHNWDVKAVWRCETLDALGLGLDFVRAKQALRTALDAWEHRNVSELPAFKEQNASSENLARALYQALAAVDLGSAKLSRVEIHETPDCCASYWED
jgi:6-pyruvoyltetrahydropterin/6-carboxytetrahydropterin synthase